LQHLTNGLNDTNKKGVALATRPDTLSLRTDVCFIKSQDLLALSKAVFLPDASSRINALRGLKSSTYIHCIGKKTEEAKEHRSRTHWQAMSSDHDLATHQHAQAGSQKKGKENNSETQPSSTFHKDDILTSSIVLPDKISGKIWAKFTTSIQKKENYKKRLILRHLSSRF
jgi:hypothetical protein